VNPASKVPAVAYGGPDVPADQPSPESAKIAESLVLLEFVADLAPDSGLLPKDPVLRAKARFFIDAVGTKFLPKYFGYTLRGGSAADVLKAAEELQELLSTDKTFAVGDTVTIADLAILPFLARAEVVLSNDLLEGGKELYAGFQEPKLARLWKYFTDLKARESFKTTFDAAYILETSKKRYADAKQK